MAAGFNCQLSFDPLLAAKPSPPPPSPSPPPFVGAFDCASYPAPLQTVKEDGTYHLMELHVPTGSYESLFTFDAKYSYINAAAYNTVDDIAYGKFTVGSGGSATDYLCKFSANPAAAPTECLCVLQAAGQGGVTTSPMGEINAGAFYEDTLYVSKSGKSVYAVTGVSSITPTIPDLSECGGSWEDVVKSIEIDISSLKLQKADLAAQFGWDQWEVAGGADQCYLKTYTLGEGSDFVSTWSPMASNSYLDIVTLRAYGATYIVALGTEDATVLIIKLSSPGVYAGFAFARPVIDWAGAKTTNAAGVAGFSGFGAAFKYGDELYFAANSGVGVMKVDLDDLQDEIARCDQVENAWTSTHVCGLLAGHTVKLTRQSPSLSVAVNDGFNCETEPDAFPDRPTGGCAWSQAMQVLKESGEPSYYKIVALDVALRTYEEIARFATSHAPLGEIETINAVGYNLVDHKGV